jgi:WD40 repeat protein
VSGEPAHRPRRRWVPIAAVAAAASLAAAVAVGVAVAHAFAGPAAAGPAATLTSPVARLGVGPVAFSPDGRVLAAGDYALTRQTPGGPADRTSLWDVSARRQFATLTEPGSRGVTSVAFSPGGQTLATADGGGNVYLWEVATRHLAATLTGPGAAGLDSVAFSRGGQTLAAAGKGGRIYLWRVATRRLAATLTDPGGGSVDSVAFSPGGQTLAGGDNNHIYLWAVH